MTADQLRAYLERLRFQDGFQTRARQAQALGLSRRTLLNYLSGRYRCPATVARLVGLFAAAAAEEVQDRPMGARGDSGFRSSSGTLPPRSPR